MIKSSFFMLLLIPLNLLAASKPYSFNLNTGILYDDNVARAVLSQDIESDTIFNLGFSADYRLPQSEHSVLLFAVGIDSYRYQDFDKLSSTILNTRVDYEIQPGHEFTSPWYLISLEYSLFNYSSSLRDSAGLSLDLSSGKRITDRISIRAGLVFENYSADADEFDISNKRIYLSTDYKLSSSSILYLTLAFTDGDTATSTTDQTTASSKPSRDIRNAHHIPGELSSQPLRMDDAFKNGFVYKLDTESSSIHLGHNYALSSHQSIDTSAFYYHSDSFGADTYDGIILQLSYLHRFQ